MRIIFIRHGKPDYKTDSLTELGWIQARSAAERLSKEGITEIYSSTMGRAEQTATPFSERSGIPVIPLDFMREINWGSEIDGVELPFGGHPWLFLPECVKAGKGLSEINWETLPDFVYNTKLQKSVKRVTDGADAWLEKLGYKREGEYYRVTGDATDKTVAVFAHGGSSTAFISHLLNLPFLSACLFIRPYFASVSTVKLEGNTGDLILPKIEILNDDRHVLKSSDEARIEK